MNLNKSSAWSEAEIRTFLAASTIPLRIATSTDTYPTLCSVWYVLDEKSNDLLCVSHENSQLVADLMAFLPVQHLVLSVYDYLLQIPLWPPFQSSV